MSSSCFLGMPRRTGVIRQVERGYTTPEFQDGCLADRSNFDTLIKSRAALNGRHCESRNWVGPVGSTKASIQVGVTVPCSSGDCVRAKFFCGPRCRCVYHADALGPDGCTWRACAHHFGAHSRRAGRDTPHGLVPKRVLGRNQPPVERNSPVLRRDGLCRTAEQVRAKTAVGT